MWDCSPDSRQEQIYEDLTVTRLLPGVLAGETDGLLQVSAWSVGAKYTVCYSYLHRLSLLLASCVDRAIVVRQSGAQHPSDLGLAPEMPGLSIAKPWCGGVQPWHFGC